MTSSDLVVPELTQPAFPAPAEASRLQKTIRALGWTLFGIFCLVFFTLLKLPEARIKNFIQGSVNAALAPRGISLSAKETSYSLGLGLSYEMKDVTLMLPPPSAPVHVDSVELSPSILSLLLGKQGASIDIRDGDGRIKGSFAMSMSAKGPTDFSVALQSKAMNIGKIGLLPMVAGVSGSAVVDGKVSLSGDLNSPATWNGNVDLGLAKIAIDQQSIQGFGIPRLSMSEGKIELAFVNGKGTIKSFKLGKPGSQDDIIGTVTGDMVLAKNWESSQLSAKTKFNLSQNVLKALPLVDALLGGAKQADGSYAYNLAGPFYALNPTPVAAGQ